MLKNKVAIIIGAQKIIDETDNDWMLMVMDTNLSGPIRYPGGAENFSA